MIQTRDRSGSKSGQSISQSISVRKKYRGKAIEPNAEETRKNDDEICNSSYKQVTKGLHQEKNREDKKRIEEREKREDISPLPESSLRKKKDNPFEVDVPKEYEDLASLLAKKIKGVQPDAQIPEEREAIEWPMAFQGISQKHNIKADELETIIEFCFDGKDQFWTIRIKSPKDIEKHLQELRNQRLQAALKGPGGGRWQTESESEKELEDALKDPGR